MSRLLFAAALAAGLSYMILGWRMDLPAWADVSWKGSGVALLALFAAARAKDADGWLLAVVMALGAAGDMLLETHGLTIGALAFLAGHVTAIVLYARNLRPGMSWRAPVLGLVPLTVLLAWWLPDGRGGPGVAFYAAGLAAMAAMAWLSRFPRALVGLGAWMFVVSDLLIFARLGPLGGQRWADYAVWTLYFAGQAMVCAGVVRAVASSDVAPRAAWRRVR